MDTKTAINLVRRYGEEEDWKTVPEKVARLYNNASPTTRAVKKIIKNLPSSDYGYVYYHPENHELWVVLGDGDDEQSHQKWHNALKTVKGITRVRTEAESLPSNRDEWIMIKKAQESAGALSGMGAPFRWGGAMTGGSSPLSNAIVGSLLAGGGGYLGGMLLEKLLPEEYIQKGRLRKTMGMLGAGLGAMPGAWQGFANYQNAQEAGKPMGVMGAAVTPTSKVPMNPNFKKEMLQTGAEYGAPYQFEGPEAGTFKPMGHEDTMDKLGALMDELPAAPQHQLAAAAAFMKIANFNQPGWSQPIYADQFQQALFADPHTPRPYAAAAAGLTSGVSQMYGNKSVLNPKHFITGLVAAGTDLVTARLVGGTLGALAGLTPKAQSKIQQMGLWGGLVRGTIGSLLS